MARPHLLLFALLQFALPSLDASPAPNIILIFVDDLGYGDLGCYGSSRNDTPHIDQLAAGGLRLTDFYSASPVCTPSRAALLTGCYPGRVGFDTFGKGGGQWVLFPGMAEGIHPDEILLPEFLKQMGYATSHVGKWHLGDQPPHLPTRHGFDSYFGIPYSNDMAIMPRRPNSPPMPLLRDEQVIQQQPAQAPLIERYTEECISFIRKNKDQPFFLYLAHLHVHLPHYTMEPFTSNSRNGRYGAAVAAIDWSTGAIMAELSQLGIEENTIIVFTSDNGSRAGNEGGSNAPLRGTKGQTWEGGMRVPCIVRWPAKISPGTSSDAVTNTMDLYPTFAAVAGYEVPANPPRDGKNILPIWLGKPAATSPHEAFFFFKRAELQAVRAGRWKLRYAFDKGPESDPQRAELYDLATDVAETTDLAAVHPEIVAQLEQHMDEIRRELGDSRLGIEGEQRRPAALVENPQPLTTFDPDYPYIEPSYLLDEAG
jgi:arylsulfatase A